jgi:PPP family 3-phenylpropionic acid transporter
MTRPTINTASRFRLFFALQFVGVGTFFPYAALYLSSIGLPGGQIGLLLAIVPLVSFLVQPLWGLFSDVYHLHRRALVLACFGVTVSMIGFGLTRDVRLLIVFTIMHAVMKGPIGILATALALEYLERESLRTGFGSLRLWGSIGFAVASFGIGAWFVENAVWWIIPFYAVTNAALGLIAMTLPNAEVHGKVRWREGLHLLRRDRSLPLFLFGILLIGFTVGIVNNYLAVYLDDIDAAGWVIGAALALSALLEVPLMARVPAFLKRWGIRLVLLGGAAVLPVRWLLYTIIDRPLLVLPTQVLHSIAMMSLLVVGVLYVDNLLIAKWRASGQALYTAALHGVGPSLGLFAAGLIYERAGITLVWLVSALVALAGTVILGLVVHSPVVAHTQQKVPS